MKRLLTVQLFCGDSTAGGCNCIADRNGTKLVLSGVNSETAPCFSSGNGRAAADITSSRAQSCAAVARNV